MKNKYMLNSEFRSLGMLVASVALAMAGCQPQPETRWQGYLEGEYVYVASPVGGRLQALRVQRGQTVTAGAALFELDATVERASAEEARQHLAQAESRVADLRKGQRPTELAALDARLAQARSAAELSGLELGRVGRLFASKVVAAEENDRARISHELNLEQITEIEAQVATAKLGGRADAIVAAEAGVAVARAGVTRAEWNVAEKAPHVAVAGLVFDTFFRVGEVVPAGGPVVAILPPANLKVRFFVPEAERATLHAGDTVLVAISDRAEPVRARINYMSPKPEYTPPVLYNRENRAKLVFMIEAEFDPADAVELLPGQPVDVSR
jgi:HlyD family secretion protein